MSSRADFEAFVNEAASRRVSRIEGWRGRPLEPGVREKVVASAHRLFRQAADDGVLEWTGSGDRLAGVAIVRSERGSLGIPVTAVRIEVDPNSAEARKWICECILRHRSRLGPDLEMIPEGLPDASPIFSELRERCGIERDLTLSYGETFSALRRLTEKYHPAADLRALDLTIEPLPTGAQNSVTHPKVTDAIVAVFAAEIARNPAYRWFAENPAYLDAKRRELLDAFADPGTDAFLIRSSTGAIVGYFAAYSRMTDPLWGPSAGTEFLFDRPIQGRGVLKVAYRRLLECLCARSIPLFLGGTNQSAVLRMNEILGRRTFAHSLKLLPEFGSLASLPRSP